ncbi:hypothetical protein FACS18948_3110 [Clostridia bacterium]|nr:hypothetical protein FACS18948_3110 [Clostridia bacterium]
MIPDVEMIGLAFQRAAEKLQWIISREGDANGDRLRPEYMDQLFCEQLYEMRSPYAMPTTRGSGA